MKMSQKYLSVPLPPYFANLAVFPSPCEVSDESWFYLLKNSSTVPVYGLSTVSVKYIPGSVYCFFPSIDEDIGTVKYYSRKPSFLDDFTYCLEINKLRIQFPGQDEGKAVIPKDDEAEGYGLDGCNMKGEDGKGIKNDTSCKGCFKSHFPRPNTKLCKFGRQKKIGNLPLLRLRGGAQDENSGEDMIERAVINANAHGINVHVG